MADQEQNIKQEYTNSVSGMNMDNVLSQVNKGQVSYALNAAVESFNTSGISYQNELGSEFCVDFPEGYALIGLHFIVEQTKQIFFLTSPLTGDSEIGYMENNDCIYHTLVNAPCLNFDVHHPVHKIVHRITNCSTEIYWTDGYNPRRYMSIAPNNIPMSIRYGTSLCDPVYSNNLDCNQLNIQPVFNIPTLEVTRVTNSGNLIAGTYQFAIQYCDASGNPFTSYYSITNPTPIADIQLATVNFNYPVGKSIILDVSNLETSGLYSYFNIAVIKTVNSIPSVELIGTYSIEKEDLQITYTGQNVTNIRLTIEDVFEKYPYYEIANDLTTAQDILIWDQLSSVDRINYQQIANKIDLQWETWRIPATENYSDEINATNLRSYLRDEVYSFELVFLLENGKQTDGFHIPGRAKNLNELVRPDIEETDDDFVGAPAYYSGGVGYSPFWKIYNTASVSGYSPDYSSLDTYKGPYQYGDFAYWESTEEYPCNIDVWGELAGTPIRHHKFPDCNISPIFETRTFVDRYSMEMGDDAVFPIGVKVDAGHIQSLISISNLSTEQKSEIVGFKIVRGNRDVNKSIVAKGILRNVNTYERESKNYFYPNYPYNDLREDPFINKTNNAYSEVCDAFTVNITQLYYDPNVGYNRALVQYIDCNTNKSGVQEYTEIGEQLQLCSIGKPSITLGKGTVSYVNYDEYRLISPALGLGWRAEYNETTTGITTQWIGRWPLRDEEVVRVVVGTVPTCILHCDRNHSIEFVGSFVTASACVTPEPISATTDEYRQIFNSPETSFGQPFLGDILKLENVIYGAGKAHFKQVLDNAKYKLLSKEAQQKALDSSAKLACITEDFNTSAMFAAYQAYLTIYINGITRRNYAYSFNSIADYNHSVGVPDEVGKKQRNIDIARYLIPAVISTGDTLDVNNWQRESSVYLKTDKTLPVPSRSPNMLSGSVSVLTEWSRFTISEVGHCNAPEEEEPIQVVSYYGSIKKDFVNQWGQIYSYETIDTGYQYIFGVSGDTTVFGGDTYISRFAFKTKLPFFIDNRVGAPDDSDIFYDEIGNIGYPKYWHSSRSILDDYTVPATGDVENTPGILVNFISYKAHNFDCPNDTSNVVTTYTGTSTTTTSTTKQSTSVVTTGDAERTFYDGYFYLFAYGIPYFYCESSYNTDLRQAFNNKEGDFWPHVSNTIPDDWVQEKFVTIANDNTYYYNITFSKQNKENYFSHLPADWDGDPCLTTYPFRAIYSDPQSTDSDNKVNNWRIYRAVSYFDFPQNYGPLTSLDGIQNRAILARFHNKTLMYGNLLTLDTSNPQAAYLGNPTLFRGAPPVDFADTDLGYAGSQHKLLLKIPEGQITIDSKRGQVFLLSGTQAIDISGFGSGMNRFLNQHLGFELLRAFPLVDIDNHFNGVGLHAVYDAKYDRVIITKLDYAPLNDEIFYDDIYRVFYVLDEYDNHIQVSLKDTDYFCNRSWTLSYNMNTKSWISFHSYLPNFYIPENNFFYSGTNDCCDDFEFIAAELPSTFDCRLWGVALLDGCLPECDIDGYACLVPPTTTTTTSSSTSTTTTSTTLCAPCALEGTAEEVCIEPSTTTTTTTECVRPRDVNAFAFITGHTIGGVTIDSTGSAPEACYEMHWLIATPDPAITINYILVEATSINVGETVYLADGRTDCECNVPDGWYFTDESLSYDFVFHVVACQIVEWFGCATTTTTSSTSSTTTTTTTIPWNCDLAGEAYEVCVEPTTTTTSSTATPPPYICGYGLLYNYYAAIETTHGGIANTGAHVPTLAEYEAMILAIGGTNVAGGKVKDDGIFPAGYWIAPNTGATHSVWFNGRGAGLRDNNGTFTDLNDLCIFITDDGNVGLFAGEILMYNSDRFYTSALGCVAEAGFSVRLVKDSTILAEGEIGSYTGNDGDVYYTICIGGVEWLAENLRETRYQDGTCIPEITDDSAWETAFSPAMCAYNNDWSNVCKDSIECYPTTTTTTTCEGCTTTTTTTCLLDGELVEVICEDIECELEYEILEVSFLVPGLYMEWRTTSPGETVTLPLVNAGGAAYNFKIYWNWGVDPDDFSVITAYNDANRIHTYAAAGTYVTYIGGQCEGWGFNGAGDCTKLIRIWGGDDFVFKYLQNGLNGCSNLIEADIPNWDVSLVTDLTGLFGNSTQVNPVLTNWDTSNVLNMSYCFSNATLANPDLSLWDTAKVTSFQYMFNLASSATPDTSSWDTSSATNMFGMFLFAPLVNPDTSNWNVSNVTRMDLMFKGASAANPDTSTWNTGNVTVMNEMFMNAAAANPDVSSWITNKVTNMQGMFAGAISATPVTTTNGNIWNVSSVTNMAQMFSSAILANPDVSDWDVSNVVDMSQMFTNAIAADPDVSLWDTSECLSMSYMFQGITTDPDVSLWNTSKVTTMTYMFRDCDFANPDTSLWNTGAVTDMRYMHNNNTGLIRTVVDSVYWTNPSVVDYVYCFNGAINVINFASIPCDWNGTACTTTTTTTVSP